MKGYAFFEQVPFLGRICRCVFIVIPYLFLLNMFDSTSNPRHLKLPDLLSLWEKTPKNSRQAFEDEISHSGAKTVFIHFVFD